MPPEWRIDYGQAHLAFARIRDNNVARSYAMNAVRMMSLALILTAGLLTAACGGQPSSASVADNPAAISPSEPTRQSAATSAPASTDALAPTAAIRV